MLPKISQKFFPRGRNFSPRRRNLGLAGEAWEAWAKRGYEVAEQMVSPEGQKGQLTATTCLKQTLFFCPHGPLVPCKLFVYWFTVKWRNRPLD
jgi:hypothetical protein